MQLLIVLSAFIWLVTAEPPTDEEREEIVEFHTRIRENVNPPASNMQLMGYSPELENLAKQYAQIGCAGPYPDPNTHSQFQGYGIVTNSDNKYDQTIISNLDENYKRGKQAYSYDTNSCTGYCSRFKTMVWSQTTAVGCTIKACQRQGILLTVCLYKPGEFEPEDRPYEKGQSCTKCPNGFACYRNQCKSTSSAVTTTSSVTITSPLQMLPALLLILRCSV
uniref:SCP domain-containing protein n=1 Tax=Mesocestoides corti TaxID=53468 RepID=A0A5K3FIA1_MESCO